MTLISRESIDPHSVIKGLYNVSQISLPRRRLKQLKIETHVVGALLNIFAFEEAIRLQPLRKRMTI